MENNTYPIINNIIGGPERMKEFDWSAIDDNIFMEHLCVDLRNNKPTSCGYNEVEKKSKIFFGDTLETKDTYMCTLIPNIMTLNLKSRELILRLTYNEFLVDYPIIIKFIKSHCPYISEFLKANNISKIEISSDFKINCYQQSDAALTFQRYMQIKNILNNHDKKSIFILLKILLMFYNNPKMEDVDIDLMNIARIYSHTLTNIDNEIKQILEMIVDPEYFLSQHNITEDRQSLTMGTYSAFKFLDHIIIPQSSTINIDSYMNLMEFKLLDKITHLSS